MQCSGRRLRTKDDLHLLKYRADIQVYHNKHPPSHNVRSPPLPFSNGSRNKTRPLDTSRHPLLPKHQPNGKYGPRPRQFSSTSWSENLHFTSPLSPLLSLPILLALLWYICMIVLQILYLWSLFANRGGIIRYNGGWISSSLAMPKCYLASLASPWPQHACTYFAKKKTHPTNLVRMSWKRHTGRLLTSLTSVYIRALGHFKEVVINFPKEKSRWLKLFTSGLPSLELRHKHAIRIFPPPTKFVWISKVGAINLMKISAKTKWLKW